jgi:hypothetical protein
MKEHFNESKAPKDGITDSSLAGAKREDLNDGYCEYPETNDAYAYPMEDAKQRGFLKRGHRSRWDER